ncbi:polyphosphate kinase 2 family protein [Terriglobus aquaticus]|uniref:Polyphosphate kinase 2 family protein n=1 Tax=Terriglobus aquaticus TaxID=940139 RepID=A0ABW9KHC3_9BACT|nr:polyphosphate kinase 2 family protein [Terriglobus aquaticus]
MKDATAVRIDPDKPLRLKKIPTDATGDFADADEAKEALKKHRDVLDKQQEVLYAGAQKALLIVLQGMDTSGKDGTIRSIFDGVNPQGCNVTSFKVPTATEAKHDFLWRVHAAVPARGIIGIFNRSHYEDVLAPRVHGIIDGKTAKHRFREIADFEAMLLQNDIHILKFFLHISFEEQGKRLQARIDDPDKHWKLSAGDFAERKLWGDYQKAYDDIFEATSTADAPWYVIPADHKWHRNVAISAVIADKLESMKLTYPKPTIDVKKLEIVNKYK